MQHIGEVLKICRLRIGWSQEALARELGIDRTVVTKVENGVIKPSYVLVKEWADKTKSKDLVGMDFNGNEGWHKLLKMESLLKSMKSSLESVNFMRRRNERGKTN